MTSRSRRTTGVRTVFLTLISQAQLQDEKLSWRGDPTPLPGHTEGAQLCSTCSQTCNDPPFGCSKSWCQKRCQEVVNLTKNPVISHFPLLFKNSLQPMAWFLCLCLFPCICAAGVSGVLQVQTAATHFQGRGQLPSGASLHVLMVWHRFVFLHSFISQVGSLCQPTSNFFTPSLLLGSCSEIFSSSFLFPFFFWYWRPNS